MGGKLWQVTVWAGKPGWGVSESWMTSASDSEIEAYASELDILKKSRTIQEYGIISAADAAKPLSEVRKGVTRLSLSGKR
jgi:hypothetical protein